MSDVWQALLLTDNLLYTVFGCCGETWSYLLPSRSSGIQIDFDENLGSHAINICGQLWNGLESGLDNLLVSHRLTQYDFNGGVRGIRRMFPDTGQSFQFMVRVAMLAAYFNKVGITEARLWAFVDICEQARLWFN